MSIFRFGWRGLRSRRMLPESTWSLSSPEAPLRELFVSLSGAVDGSGKSLTSLSATRRCSTDHIAVYRNPRPPAGSSPPPACLAWS